MSNKYKTLLGDTFIFALGSIGSKFVSFILVPYYTSLLTTSEYGSIDLITSFSNLIIPIASLVMHEAVLRFGLSKGIKRQSVISNAMVALIASALLIVCCAPLLRMYDTISPWIPQLIVISVIHMINNTLFAYTKVLRKNRVYAFISVAYALLFALLNILMMSALKMRVEGYLLANIIALCVTTVILILWTGAIKDISIKSIDRTLMKKMITYSAPLIFNSISWWVIHSISKVVLEADMSTAALGLFSAASKIPALLAIFTAIFQQAWVLSAITDYENGADKLFFKNVFNYYSVIMTLATSGIVLGSKIFMRFYVGAAFFESWRYVPVLLLGILYNAYSAFFGSIYSAAKKNKQIAVSTVISAVIVLALSLFLIPRFGIMGSAVANTSAYVFIGIFRCIDSRKYVSIDIDLKKTAFCHLLLLVQIVLTCMDFYLLYIGAIVFTILLIMNYRTIKDLWINARKIYQTRGKEKDAK